MSSPADDLPPIQHQPTRHAAEWGFASMFLAGILAILAVLTLQLCAALFFGPPMWARSDLQGIFFASIGAAILVVAMNVASAAFGVMSLMSALRQRQPCALGVAGLMLSVFALLIWIFAFIDLFSVLVFLMRRQGHGGFF